MNRHGYWHRSVAWNDILMLVEQARERALAEAEPMMPCDPMWDGLRILTQTLDHLESECERDSQELHDPEWDYGDDDYDDYLLVVKKVHVHECVKP